jgi:hypothetical protein
VRALATWVAGFIDAFPPRDEIGMAHPLSRATRREMQQPMQSFGAGVTFSATDAHPELDGGAYGFGLFVNEDLRWGRVVGHSGGYPGFGSNMRWHPASGLGVIVLANGRYAPASPLARDLLHALLDASAVPVRRVRPAPATLAARAAVEALIERWDDARAAALFAMNVELDEPLERRRAFIERLRVIHGRLSADPSEPARSQSPFQLAWWLRGERGRVKAEILLTPELPPRVQALSLTSVREPPDELANAAEQIAAALNAGDGVGPAWPAELTLDASLDPGALARTLRATEARFGKVRLGSVIAGDGERAATFRLDSARGHLDLELERDVASGRLTRVRLRPERLGPVDFD